MLLDFLNDKKLDSGKKLDIIDEALTEIWLSLEGDKVVYWNNFYACWRFEPFLNHIGRKID